MTSSLYDRVAEHRKREDQVRELIKEGKFQKVGSDYRFELPDGVYFYGAGYVERMIEWNKE